MKKTCSNIFYAYVGPNFPDLWSKATNALTVLINYSLTSDAMKLMINIFPSKTMSTSDKIGDYKECPPCMQCFVLQVHNPLV